MGGRIDELEKSIADLMQQVIISFFRSLFIYSMNNHFTLD